MIAIVKTMPDLLRCENAVTPSQFLVPVKMSDSRRSFRVQSPTPWVFFLCTGMISNGDDKHDMIIIGATKERFLAWPEMQEQRDAARNDLVGEEAQIAWERRLLQVATLEGSTENTEAVRQQIRKDVMLRNWHNLTLDQTTLAQELMENQLRRCSDHYGQAYSLVDWNTYKAIGCCWLCKMSVGYTEIAADNLEKAKLFNHKDRKKVPHSCAEVASSGWCDDIGSGEA